MHATFYLGKGYGKGTDSCRNDIGRLSPRKGGRAVGVVENRPQGLSPLVRIVRPPFVEPFVDFLCMKDRPDNRATYLAEIYDAEHLRLLHGLFLYHAVDEIVFYLLPVIRRGGVSIVGEFSAAEWKCVQIRQYGNGICRIVYHKLLQ